MCNKIIKIAGVGCALADYLYTDVNFNSKEFTQFLSKQTGDGGLTPGKLVFKNELEHFARKPYAEILSEILKDNTSENFNIGGPSLVSLIHVAQVLPKEQFETSYYGCCGDDMTGEQIIEVVKQTPLNISNYIKIKGKDTAFTDVLSDRNFDEGNGERTFINSLEASDAYTMEMIPDSFYNAHIVCFGGTALVPQIHDNLTKLLKKAKKNNCITVVNTVYDFRNEKKHPNKRWPLGDNADSLKMIDLLVMDCEEAIKISGEKSIDGAAAYFKQADISSFIITNGSKNVYAFSNGKIFTKLDIVQFPVSEEIVVELKKNNNSTGDTTGCGDNFAGGVIASMAMQLCEKPIGNFDLIESLSWGITAGGFACFYTGGTYIEKHTGEKSEKITRYQENYLKQIATK